MLEMMQQHVTSWMLNSVLKKIAASVIFIKSAEKMWIALRDQFLQRNRSRIFQLKREK